jgi:hypothetical protein
MANDFLMITSPGVAPLEGFLLMGASDKDSGDPNTIGMFGSGIKYSVAQLGRVGRLPIVYLGANKLEWDLRQTTVRGTQHQEIVYRLNGGGWKSYGSVLKMGERDWNDLWMPVREFVSNALDEVGGNPAGIQIGLVDKPRAKSGETRVYVPWQVKGAEDVTAGDYLQRGLEAMFLHFRMNGNQLRQQYGPIGKSAPGPPQFFRRGVLIRGWQGQGDQAKPSLYDYNFKDLDLDEARKASDWDIAYKVGQMLANDPEVFADMVMKLAREDAGEWWEGKLLNEYALTSYGQTTRDKITEALARRLGDKGVLAASEASAQIAKNRGLQPVVVPVAWAHAIENMGGPTVGNIVGDMAKQGREEQPLPGAVLARGMEWCRQLELWGLTANKPRPGFVGFREHPGQSGITKGQYSTKLRRVELNLELGGEDLDMTILEELGHHYSGQADFTRGFQGWLLRVVMMAMKEAAKIGEKKVEEYLEISR